MGRKNPQGNIHEPDLYTEIEAKQMFAYLYLVSLVNCGQIWHLGLPVQSLINPYSLIDDRLIYSFSGSAVPKHWFRIVLKDTC